MENGTMTASTHREDHQHETRAQGAERWSVERKTNLIKITSNSLDGWDPLAGENLVATIYGDAPRDLKRAAQIAALPDMLAALKRLAKVRPDGLDHSMDILVVERVAKLASEAIAKAEGRT